MALFLKKIKNDKNLSIQKLKILLEKEFIVEHINKDTSWEMLKIKHLNLKFSIQILPNIFNVKIYPPIWWNFYLLLVPSLVFLLVVLFISIKFEFIIACGAFSFIGIPLLSNFIFFNNKVKVFFISFNKTINLL